MLLVFCLLLFKLLSSCSKWTGFWISHFSWLEHLLILSIQQAHQMCTEATLCGRFYLFWFLSVLPDCVLQFLVLIRLICFLLLLWQQVVIVGRLGTHFVTENCTFLTCQHLTWLAILCLLNGKIVVVGFFFNAYLGVLSTCNYLFRGCCNSFRSPGGCSHWSNLTQGDYGLGFSNE